MEGVPMTIETVASDCKNFKLKTAAELNNYIFNCEVVLFPLECKNYRENIQSLNFYVGVVNLLEIALDFKLRREMFVLRDKMRKSRIEDGMMKKIGFKFSTTIEEFPEGHRYGRLYDMYVNEKNKDKKYLIRDMILITQKKWDSGWGLFPKPTTIKCYLKTARRLIKE